MNLEILLLMLQGILEDENSSRISMHSSIFNWCISSVENLIKILLTLTINPVEVILIFVEQQNIYRYPYPHTYAHFHIREVFPSWSCERYVKILPSPAFLSDWKIFEKICCRSIRQRISNILATGGNTGLFCHVK